MSNSFAKKFRVFALNCNVKIATMAIETKCIWEGNRTVPERLEALKKVIILGMLREAKSRISRKNSREGWSGGVDLDWVNLVVHVPRTWCNGIARYTLLRWALNQDDDVWLSLRGARHQQLCGTCGLPGDTFPFGYYHPPWCEACARADYLDAWSVAPWSFPLYCAYVSEQPHHGILQWKQQWAVQPANEVVCRACGCGDNTVGHWTRWCVVPLIVASAILRPRTCPLSLCQLAVASPRHAAVCTLVIANFRRLLTQEGAFLHQSAAEPKEVTWWVIKLHEMVAQDAHIELQVHFPVSCGASGRCSLCSEKVDVQRILPLEYSTMHLPAMVGICTTSVSCDDQVTVLPLNSPITAAPKEMDGSPLTMQCNVKVCLLRCTCGEFHVQIVAVTDICSGDVLVMVPSRSCPPRILVQFDGSAHRLSKKGGAGAALLQVESTGVSFLDWGARALHDCRDSIVAEAHGAGLAICLYEKYLYMCHQQGTSPLPLDRIQGDIKPLIQHLDFRGRFRRNDLVSLLNKFHPKRSRIAPNAITEYRPREANAIADYLVGRASAYLCNGELVRDEIPAVPFAIPTDPPYELLLAANAVILGPHPDGKVVLHELPGCDFYQMAGYAQWMNGQ